MTSKAARVLTTSVQMAEWFRSHYPGYGQEWPLEVTSFVNVVGDLEESDFDAARRVLQEIHPELPDSVESLPPSDPGFPGFIPLDSAPYIHADCAP